jgi:hypothetical protein
VVSGIICVVLKVSAVLLCCCILQSYPNLVHKPNDLLSLAGELVGLIDKLEHQYSVIADLPTFARTGKAPNVTEFISGDGMSALVHIAVTGWPADGNLAASKHPYDIVTDVGAAALKYEADSMTAVKGVKKSGPKWRSPRRRAIVCLSVLGHYRY